MKRILVLSSLLASGLASLAWSQTAAPAPAASAPAALDPANFTGTVTSQATTDVRLLRYTFAPSARTNWHSHAAGQVIFVEQGTIRLQERGGAGRELKTRETYVAPAGVAHWHGALPGDSLTQVSLSFGATTWLEPVTDRQYADAGRR